MSEVPRPSTISAEEALGFQQAAVRLGVATPAAEEAVTEAKMRAAVLEVSGQFPRLFDETQIQPQDPTDPPEILPMQDPFYPRLWIPPEEDQPALPVAEEPRSTMPPTFGWAFIGQQTGYVVRAARAGLAKFRLEKNPTRLGIHDPLAPRTLSEMQMRTVAGGLSTETPVDNPSSGEKYPDPDDALGVYGSGEGNDE